MSIWLPSKYGMYEVKPETLNALGLRFPLANVERELCLLSLWLEKHPARRPIKPLRMVENWLKKASPKAPLIDIQRAQWWTNEKASLAMGKQVGIEPKPRESWAELRARIADKIKRSA